MHSRLRKKISLKQIFLFLIYKRLILYCMLTLLIFPHDRPGPMFGSGHLEANYDCPWPVMLEENTSVFLN